MQYGYNEDHWIWEAEWEDISSRMNAEVMSARKTVLVRNAGWAPNAQGLIGFVTMHQSAFSSARSKQEITCDEYSGRTEYLGGFSGKFALDKANFGLFLQVVLFTSGQTTDNLASLLEKNRGSRLLKVERSTGCMYLELH